MKRIIVDGNNYLMMAISAAERSGRISISGSILGNMLGVLFRTFGKDSSYYVCFDSRGGTTFRKEIDSGYKAERRYDPERIREMENIMTVFSDNGFMDCTIESCEADDSMFALCRVLSEMENADDIYVVTRDRDMIQTVQHGYAGHVWDPHTKKDMVIPPYSIVAFKALSGDRSDGIQGLKGVGPRTAVKILNGERILTESQKEIFNRNLLVIDARLNPRYEENVEFMRIRLSLPEREPSLLMGPAY